MAMALDPNLPYDDKRRIGMVRAGTAPDIMPGADSGAGLDFGNGGGQLQIPTRQAIAAGLRARETPPAPAANEGTVGSTPTVTAPAAPASELPDGVRKTSVGGIYEGKRGYAGERVFSDNPYDNLLTDRSGGMARRAANDVAASEGVLEGTRGFTDRTGRPVDTPIDRSALRSVPRYNFSNSGDPAAYNAGSRSGAPLYSREWEQANQRLPTAQDVDPEGKLSPEQLRGALAEQVSANKQALAMSRVQRGVATGAGSSYPQPGVGVGAGGMPPGVNPLDYIKTISDVQRGQAGEARQQREQDIGLQQKNEDRANGIFDSALKGIQEDQRYARLPPYEQAKAAHIRAAIALEDAGIDPSTTTRGRLGMTLLGQALAETTNSQYDPSTFVPPEQADLGRFNVRRGSGLERISNPYVAEGPAFAPDPKTGKMVEVAPGTEGSTQNNSVRLGALQRDLPAYLQVGTSGDLGAIRGLIERQRAKSQQYTAAQQAPRGAARRYAY